MGTWTKLEDGLPKEGTLVVGAHIFEDMEPDAAVFWFYDGRFRLWTDGLTAENHDGGAVIRSEIDITHWKPLFP